MMDEYEVLRQAISDATRYMRVYLAKVLQDLDPENKGRVQVVIPALGIIDAAEGVWADVEQPIGVNVSPVKDDWVAVYFLNGDPSKPVVRGRTSTVKDNLPENSDKKQVFYEDENTKIYYDEQNKKLSIETSYETEITLKGEKNTITAEKTVEVVTKDEVTLKPDKKVTIEGKDELEIKCDKKVTLKGGDDGLVIDCKGKWNDHLEVS